MKNHSVVFSVRRAQRSRLHWSPLGPGSYASRDPQPPGPLNVRVLYGNIWVDVQTFESMFRPTPRPETGCSDLLQGYLWADVQTCYKGTFEWMFRPATRVPLMALGSQPTEGTGVSACTIPGTRAENNHNHKTATKQQQTKQNRNKNNNSKNHTYTQQDRRFFFKRYLFVKTDYNPRMC